MDVKKTMETGNTRVIMHEFCPYCGEPYNDDDFEYQFCSKCNFDNSQTLK